MAALRWLLRRYKWLVAISALLALFTLIHFKRQPTEVKLVRRYRSNEQHANMANWPTPLAQHWRANTEQLAVLDTIIHDAQCTTCHDDIDWSHRQQRVVSAARTGWHSYARDAFGHDDYFPLSHRGSNFTHLGIGYIVADVLDTLWLMGLRDEYKMGRDFLANQVSFDQRGTVSLFESTIRILGGLLSAYHLSGETDTKLLMLADDLGSRLAKSFNTTTGIPPETATLRSDGMSFAYVCSTSESSTLQLEFRYLAHLTNNPMYKESVDRIIDVMLNAPKYDSLVPTRIDAKTGLFVGTEISLGSRGDSYYEYMLKQWLQTKQSEVDLRVEYDAAVRGIKKYLVRTSPRQGLTYVGEMVDVTGEPKFSPKMDHLVCFLAGNLALGATNGTHVRKAHLSARDRDDLVLARELGETCAHMYFDTPSGLAPEIAYFALSNETTNQILSNGDILVPPLDRHSLLRPETVESFYLLWKLTGEKKWREYGWRVFEAIERCAHGEYTSLDDVTVVPPTKRDSVESFFVAETLKYLYLLFDDGDRVPLTHYVFNTEAHPLPIFSL
ncbi:mannosyl-oligosaccharide alpha-1,2-mannosidase [Coemansia sp. RSA 2523]|nr:mannosyl-oligosaccharide alpha-1,2-mannosidase [Coemansia sp. RSA 2523]KAJ2169874.1 mannosyl-oligosaccharide alpha-1,2-mannosidase [Coemansia sp. RSA 562]KAJ2175817.1 mannosyl-oligosaccharide alpha-1,2-mannosidase [Coemansia sp. RSA 560]KAJ2208454.1 mannosyl-oligosaccharide alpha-1,2-mannosidase [Coemansia sp. RSA 521]KAJ2222833.1 mannosyl-oligosaccharide alpha-1,2-mannosidase [Coemansia sp. RSA 520]KAJ2227124.1 mannosyl-oligosaccharide alpha-1,2-mannosidase [Coemansia sp. RSA 518]KAJ22781